MKLISEIRKSQTVIFPVIGKVTFDKNGVIEVSEKDGNAILEKKVNDVRKFGTKSEKQKGVAKKKSAMQDQIDSAKSNITSMKSYKDLHKVCEDAKLDKAIWGDMKIPELKAYLIGQIDPSTKKEEAPKEEAPEAEDSSAEEGNSEPEEEKE